MKKKLFYIIFLFSIALALESSIPYFYAAKKCKPDHVFLGQVISTFDHNMYFSFIRQARAGHFVFFNRLTYMEHRAAFINLEFWLVGSVQRITGLDENGLYTLWRLAGILMLVTGFVLLADLVLDSLRKVLCATALFLFSGGIGFIHALLNHLGLRAAARGWSIFGYSATSSLALDTSSCIMPFNQAMTNPHFTLPTGLALLGYYFFVKGYQREQLRNYLYSGCLFLAIGLIRPYDILPALVVIPLFTIYLHFRPENRQQPLKSLLTRLSPVLFILPALMYDIWLFHDHPVFRYWSSQGDNAFMIPSFLFHYLNFGVIGLLALARLALIRKFPLKKTEVFLVILFSVTLFINHLGRYTNLTPWSFQVGAYLAAPLVLLACSPDYNELAISKNARRATLVTVAALVAVSNLAVLIFRCTMLSDNSNQTHMYALRDEYNSWMWLRTHTQPGELLLASTYTSSRIAKYTDLRVVAGHPFVTPEYEATTKLAMQVTFDSVIAPASREILNRLKVNYIFVGPTEKTFIHTKLPPSAFITPVFSNNSVDIYRINLKSGTVE